MVILQIPHPMYISPPTSPILSVPHFDFRVSSKDLTYITFTMSLLPFNSDRPLFFYYYDLYSTLFTSSTTKEIESYDCEDMCRFINPHYLLFWYDPSSIHCDAPNISRKHMASIPQFAISQEYKIQETYSERWSWIN